MAPRRGSSALSGLRRVSGQTEELFEGLSRVSSRASERTSEVLVGAFGGTLGFATAYGISLAVAAVSFAIAAPIGGALGIAGAILVYRGPRRFALERALQDQQMIDEAILQKIKNLPRNAPQSVRDDLWNRYIQFQTPIQNMPFIMQNTNAQLQPPPQQAALPPPDQ